MLIDVRFDKLIKVLAIKSRPRRNESTTLVRGVLAHQRCVVECLDHLRFIIYCLVGLIEIRKSESIEIEVFILGHMDTSRAHSLHLFFSQLHFFDRIPAPEALRYGGARPMWAFFFLQLVPTQGILSYISLVTGVNPMSTRRRCSFHIPGLSQTCAAS